MALIIWKDCNSKLLVAVNLLPPPDIANDAVIRQAWNEVHYARRRQKCRHSWSRFSCKRPKQGDCASIGIH